MQRHLAAGNHEAALEAMAGTWRLWMQAGDLAGGRELMRAVLDVASPMDSHARAHALYGDGVLAFRSGDREGSMARNEAALTVAIHLGDAELEALAMVGLCRVYLRDGDYVRVVGLASQAMERVREEDRTALVMPLHLLAAGTRLGGDLDRAIQLYQTSLELNRGLGDAHMVATELHNLGHVELHRGRIEAAVAAFSACWPMREADDPYDSAMTALNRSALAHAHGDREAAIIQLRDVAETLRAAGIVLDPDDAFEVSWLTERLGDTGSA